MREVLSDIDRIVETIGSLPAEHVARYRLGLWLEMLIRHARISHTADDEAFLRQLAQRFTDQHDPDMRRDFLDCLHGLL
jgi:hypothetical protein